MGNLGYSEPKNWEAMENVQNESTEQPVASENTESKDTENTATDEAKG